MFLIGFMPFWNSYRIGVLFPFETNNSARFDATLLKVIYQIGFKTVCNLMETFNAVYFLIKTVVSLINKEIIYKVAQYDLWFETMFLMTFWISIRYDGNKFGMCRPKTKGVCIIFAKRGYFLYDAALAKYILQRISVQVNILMKVYEQSSFSTFTFRWSLVVFFNLLQKKGRFELDELKMRWNFCCSVASHVKVSKNMKESTGKTCETSI